MSLDERVVPFDLGVRWQPVSDPLLTQEKGHAMLFVSPHFDDPDQRTVVLEVLECDGVWVGPPNDEARSGHRLWARGLSECTWAAEVLNSNWIANEIKVNSVHPHHRPEAFEGLRHWILLFKESTAECLGRSISIGRIDKEVRVVRFE
jgi:hypothetical protein